MPGIEELLIILAIVLVIFGGSKLPQLARSLGRAKSEFSEGLKEGEQKEPSPERADPADGSRS
jgi:sec-independent protein translocase protein TatA